MYIVLLLLLLFRLYQVIRWSGFPHVLENLHFPGPGNVLEFCKIRKCTGKLLPVKNSTWNRKACE